MADRFYGVALGGKLTTDVTESGTTTAAAIELRINDTAYGTGANSHIKLQVLEAIRALQDYVSVVETNPIA